MADDIIDIEDYEVKDSEIVETTSEDEYQRTYDNQRDYDQRDVGGFYRSFSLNNTSLIIVLMVIALLVIIFLMTFD